MFPGRPGRIEGFSYLGLHRYSLTLCTNQRESLFTNSQLVEAVLTTMRTRCTVDQFALFAYCFMPDHVHLLVQGMTEDSDLQRFVARCKQLTGFRHRQATGHGLWQESYHEHVLRDDEETWRTARYILENPVRRGLAATFSDYPHCGSDMFNTQQLNALWQPARQG